MEGCQVAQPQADSFPFAQEEDNIFTANQKYESKETGNTVLQSSGWVTVNDQADEKQLVLSSCLKYLED